MQELRDGCYHFENGDGGGFFVTVKNGKLQRGDENNAGEVIGTIRVMDRTYTWSRHLDEAPKLVPKEDGSWVIQPSATEEFELQIEYPWEL